MPTKFNPKLAFLAATLFLLLSHSCPVAAEPAPSQNRCYSCASDNMKENFLTRERGPPGRVREPRLFDSMCDMDAWLIRERSAVECEGACFKWQQVLNNSGVLSYATIRGCFAQMFDPATGPVPSPGPTPSYTTECKHVLSPLTCLDLSSVQESTCWCMGDFCNGAAAVIQNFASLMLMVVFASILALASSSFSAILR